MRRAVAVTAAGLRLTRKPRVSLPKLPPLKPATTAAADAAPQLGVVAPAAPMVRPEPEPEIFLDEPRREPAAPEPVTTAVAGPVAPLRATAQAAEAQAAEAPSPAPMCCWGRSSLLLAVLRGDGGDGGGGGAGVEQGGGEGLHQPFCASSLLRCLGATGPRHFCSVWTALAPDETADGGAEAVEELCLRAAAEVEACARAEGARSPDDEGRPPPSRRGEMAAAAAAVIY
eukprot:COSAG01_NODE_12869_length_1672_cov_2.970121_2_plen_229_part_00